MTRFQTEDSGQRQEFASGMVRDTDENKTLWALVADGPMLQRWAELLTRGAVKYRKRNWMLAAGDEEYERFRESAFRHFMQWYLGLNPEEDHAAALFFNVNGAEYVKDQQVDYADLREMWDTIFGVITEEEEVSLGSCGGCEGCHCYVKPGAATESEPWPTFEDEVPEKVIPLPFDEEPVFVFEPEGSDEVYEWLPAWDDEPCPCTNCACDIRRIFNGCPDCTCGQGQ